MVGICSRCKSSKKVSKNRKTGKIRCSSCSGGARYHDESKWEICSLCPPHRKKPKPVQSRTTTGKPVCPSCHQLHLYFPPQEECARCHNTGPVALRTESDKAICKDCYRKYFWSPPQERCIDCKEIKPVHQRTKDGPRCQPCYKRWRRECISIAA